MENANKEVRLKYLEDCLIKFKKHKRFFQAFYLGLTIFFAFFEAGYMINLGTAIISGSAQAIFIYIIIVLLGLWLGVSFLKDFLSLDQDEMNLKCLIQKEKKKP